MNYVTSMSGARSATINGISILVGKWDNHDIPNVIYVSINVPHVTFAIINGILKDVADMELRILFIERKGFLDNLGVRNSWFMGTPETITMFSLKYKKYIKASMDQKAMNKAMGILEGMLSQEPGYRLNYQNSLRRLAMGREIILESSKFDQQENRGRDPRALSTLRNQAVKRKSAKL